MAQSTITMLSLLDPGIADSLTLDADFADRPDPSDAQTGVAGSIGLGSIDSFASLPLLIEDGFDDAPCRIAS